VFGFGAILALAGRAAHLEAVRQRLARPMRHSYLLPRCVVTVFIIVGISIVAPACLGQQARPEAPSTAPLRIPPSAYPTLSPTPPGRPIPTAVPSSTAEPASTLLPPSDAITTATPFSEHALFRGSVLFNSEECGIQFRHPSGWEVQPSSDEFGIEYPCLFGMHPPNWNAEADRLGLCLGDHAIYVGSASGTWKDVRALRFFPLFSQRDGRWFSYEPQFLMEFEIPQVTSGDLSIVQDTVMTRTYADCEAGGFAGLDGTNYALVFDKAQHFAVLFAVPFSPIDAFELAVASLEFVAAH